MIPNGPWTGLVLTRKKYWDRMRASGRWAYKDQVRRRLKGWKAGDLALVYLIPDADQPHRGVTALIKFLGDAKHDPGVGFDAEFPWQLPFEIIDETWPPIDLKKHLNHLESFPNRKHWGSYLQGRPALVLQDDDFAYLRGVVCGNG